MEKQKGFIKNRIISFLAGGLAVFIVMNFTVVQSAKTKNAQMSKALDVSQYEAPRLLADAKAQFENKNFTGAKDSLSILFENQPGSAEASEGKELLVTIEKADNDRNARWDAAEAGIQKKWYAEKTLEIRAQADEDRAQIESDLKSTLDQTWENTKDSIRSDWENSI